MKFARIGTSKRLSSIRAESPAAKRFTRFCPQPIGLNPSLRLKLGETFPYWELATYITDPASLSSAAQAARLDLIVIVAAIVSAIGFGGALILFDVRRQMALAEQKSEFVSSVSHELRTPLTSIRMFSELLEHQGADNPGKTRRYAKVIGIEVDRLTRLIDNVLDIARIERGDKSYEFKAVSLNDLIDETVERFRPQFESAQFAIRVESGDSQAATVKADRDALSQVLVNLLSNAIQHGTGEVREITVSLQGSGQHAVVKVEDCGPGVPVGHEERVFEKFYRAGDAADAGGRGSGIGLALAREIVVAHGGEVTYSSRKNGGSCFSFWLPISPETPGEV